MTDQAQVAVAGGLLAATVALVATFSGFSALNGPRWALRRVARLRWAGGLMAATGLALTVYGHWWLVAVVVYLGFSLVLVASVLKRSLTRLEVLGGLDETPPEVVIRRLRGAQLGLIGMALVFGATALILPPVATINAVLALIMLGNWTALRVASVRARATDAG